MLIAAFKGHFAFQEEVGAFIKAKLVVLALNQDQIDSGVKSAQNGLGPVFVYGDFDDLRLLADRHQLEEPGVGVLLDEVDVYVI